ncbi:MAG: type IX secretion system membrane protein PorP/SprF [Bacteroidales bacterium]|nr:type IX secretion system membrane protein PorP/SprF [Bacteroidales bacterium]
MRKSKYHILVFVLMLFMAQGLKAQYPQGQFWTPELRINPAFTGVMQAKWRLKENYRNQTYESGLHVKWNTVSADIKKEITKEVGGYGLKMTESSGNTFGFGIMDDRRMSDTSNAEYIADYFSLAYHRALKNGASIGIGVQPGYMRNANENKFDLNAGLLWGQGMVTCWQEDQYFKNQIGVSMYNILSNWQDSSFLPGREIQVHAGFLIDKPEQFNIVANGYYRYNGTSEFAVGAYVLFFPIVHYAFYDRARLGLHYRSTNHLSWSAGLRLYGRGKKTLTLDGTISYDMPMKFMDFESPYKNAFEIGIVITSFEKCWSLGKCK